MSREPINAARVSGSEPPSTGTPDWRQLADDNVSVAILTIDLQGQVTSFNPASRPLCHHSDPSLGEHWTDLIALAPSDEISDPVKRTIGTGRPIRHWLTEAIDPQGRRIPVAVDTARLEEPPGNAVGCLLTLRDLHHLDASSCRPDRSPRAFQDIIGTSPTMRRVFDRLPVFAESDTTVLIEGASGTGKELVARALHKLSPRRRQRFVALNCGALPDTLLESELFGYKRGAFTDARRDKPGRFAAAEGGTLFLDEIGDISPAMQVRLLRVLQERVYEPLGSVTPVRTNVRVVVATHHDLHEQVRAGRFRDDLLYRIDVIRLQLPTLRERPEDIPLLAEHFIAHFNRSQNKDVEGLSPAALRTLLLHDYPGNVRELENIIEHAFVLIGEGLIEPEHLPPWLGPRPARKANNTQMPQAMLPIGAGLSLADLENLAIDDALRRHDGNRRAAAAELGINPSTLFRKLKARQAAKDA
ncbi:MAG: sigma 54-interacting transcriptional regulator [Planctomycetota bacterium]